MGSRNGALGAAALIVAAITGECALAQAPQRVTANPGAADHAVIRFSIPAQPLAPALASFGNAADLQVLYTADVARNMRTNGVQGAFSKGEALRRLLAGTGLVYRFTNASTVTIERTGSTRTAAASVPGAIPLDTIEIEGGQQAFGPVHGYVAENSSSATKMNTPIISTPASVSVVTRQQIDEQQVQSVPEALRYSAGVQPESRGAMTALDYIYARGFPVNQYQDGLRLQMSGGYALPQIDPYHLERIEVLRGPASVLYGQGDLGGTVNLVSKRPTDVPFHEVQLQFGNYKRVQTAFDFGGPIDAGKEWTYRVSGIGHKSDTQVDFAKDERISIAPALRWRPDADTSLTLLANYQHDPNVGFYNWVPGYGTVLTNPFMPGAKIPTSFNAGDPAFDRYSRTLGEIGYQFEHRFNDVFTVRQNLRYSHVDSAFDRIYASYLDADFHTLNRYAWRLRDQLNGVAVDNQLQADFATGPVRHKVLLGVDYQNTSYRQQLGYNFDPSEVPPIDIFNPVYFQSIPIPELTDKTNQTQSQLGFYAQDHIEIGKLNLLLGGRSDSAKARTDVFYLDQFIDSTPQTDRAFTGRAGAVYVFDSGIAPYVSFAQSFLPTIGVDANLAPFKPTTGTQYEAGLKFQPNGTNGFVTFSVYDLTQQNVLTPDPATGGRTSIQVGEIRSRGIELSAVASLSESLNVVASFSRMSPTVTKSSNIGLAVGSTPVGLPDMMASLWADYTIKAGPAGGVGFGAGVRYVGKSFGDDANTFSIPDATVVDAALRYDFGVNNPSLRGLQVAINASNLFDKEYVATCLNADYCAYGLRRKILGTVTYRW